MAKELTGDLRGRIKAMFFDIDDTIVSKRTHRITDADLYALGRARAEGIKLVICTGRYRHEINNDVIFNGFDFDGYIACTGQHCYDSKSVIYSESIDRGDIAAFLQLITERDYSAIFGNNDGMFANSINPPLMDTLVRLRLPHPEIIPAAELLKMDYFQVTPFIDRDEDAGAPLEVMPHSQAAYWLSGHYDICPAGGCKSRGVLRMLEHYGIAPENAMAFGDADNDVDMLSALPYSVALGNSTEAAINAAAYVTRTVDESGVAYALETLNII